jgi:peroxiredoxin
MKIFNRYIGIALCLATIVLTSSSYYDDTKALKAFSFTAKQLQVAKVVKHHYKREFNYPSEDYISKAEGDMYVDFGKENDLVGFRYQYAADSSLSVFNNAEAFNTDAKAKTIDVKHGLKPAGFEGKSALYNSIITLRNILPLVINDKSITKTVRDTLIKNKSYNVLQFALHNRLLNYLGTGFSTTTGDLTFVYKIIADKSTGLPLTVLQTRVGSTDLNRTDFENINLHPAPVSETSWYYSSYLPQYTLTSPGKPLVLIKTGETAPDWTLTNFETNAMEKLSDDKGKLVLLEFWIKNCGHCIEAVPALNSLNDVYNKRGLKVLAINTEDSKTAIASFVTKHAANYTVAFGAAPAVNKSYGVAAFPQVVLVDKTGVVVYSGNFDVEKLKPIIDQHLN